MSAAVLYEDVPPEIDRRLERWGQFARGRYDLVVNERTPLGRIIDEGAMAAGQSSDWGVLHMPDDILEVDQAVAGLPRRYQKALKVHYMTALPTLVKCQLVRTSRAKFYLLVNAGKVGVWMALRVKRLQVSRT